MNFQLARAPKKFDFMEIFSVELKGRNVVSPNRKDRKKPKKIRDRRLGLGDEPEVGGIQIPQT